MKIICGTGTKVIFNLFLSLAVVANKGADLAC